jgi:hypothetical protein
MDDSKYCGFCCDYEVGITMVGRKKECLSKCADALNNIIAPGNYSFILLFRNLGQTLAR